MKIYADELVGCVDCLCYVANGDVPQDRPELPAIIAARYPAPLHVVTACEETACEENGEGWFSWRTCDICGCRLGGERHSMAVLAPEDYEENAS